MPITELPLDTVRSIGSALVLKDSCSVVKELIDNSLDACASAIFVELSINTLDVIQVKDNGHGIAPVDRAMVCRRHCTSKITSFEDLRNIGGKSLGFRGEALASVVAMTGSMVVSTRIAGEATGVSLTINRHGGIEKYVLHPLITTLPLFIILQRRANISTTWNYCPDSRFSQRYTGPPANCLKGTGEINSYDQKTIAILRFCSAVCTFLPEGTQSEKCPRCMDICSHT